MGIRIAQRSRTYGSKNRSWCVFNAAEYNLGVTLDPTLFSSGSFPNGLVPSGQVLAIVTATGLAGPYNSGLSNGQQTPIGYLLNDEELFDLGSTTGDAVSTAVMTVGVIIPARLPSGSGDSGAVHTALPRISLRTI